MQSKFSALKTRAILHTVTIIHVSSSFLGSKKRTFPQQKFETTFVGFHCTTFLFQSVPLQLPIEQGLTAMLVLSLTLSNMD